MAKNKKKSKKPQAPPKPKHEKTTTLIPKPKTGNKLAIETMPCLPDLGGTGSYLQNDYDVVYVGSDKNIIANLEETGIFKNSTPEQIKELVEKWCDKYLRSIIDIPDELNIYSTKKYNNDIIDLTDYISDVIVDGSKSCPVGKMTKIINETDFDYDPSWFWSTDEFFDIKISENLLYKARRIMYDDKHHSVRYYFVEYQRFYLNDNVYVTIPTLEFAVQFQIITADISSLTAKYKPEYQPADMTFDHIDMSAFYNANEVCKAIVNSYQKMYGNICKMVEINSLGAKYISELSYYVLETCHKIINKQDLNTLRSFLAATQMHIYYSFRNQNTNTIKMYHRARSGGIFSSALFITNKLLKDKKLSKPIKTSHNKAETEIILQNVPERKTRILGDTIKISSESRPTSPDMSKLIKYHTPEWDRKEHLRKLKDGRIIKINASRCLRKCVDMHGAKSKLPKTATDYKIVKEVKDK